MFGVPAAHPLAVPLPRGSAGPGRWELEVPPHSDTVRQKHVGERLGVGQSVERYSATPGIAQVPPATRDAVLLRSDRSLKRSTAFRNAKSTLVSASVSPECLECVIESSCAWPPTGKSSEMPDAIRWQPPTRWVGKPQGKH